MNGELLAGEGGVVRVGNEFVPKGGRAAVITQAFGQQGKIATSYGAKFGRQAEIESQFASHLGALGSTSALKKT